ncbi:MAG: hypothetical protein K2M13_02355 [Muribaculaceae bacterium]|nr:hypothetical protein [Muribaculaceae bacterium]
MTDFELEILNAASSDKISLLSKEAMSEACGGEVECKKGYHLTDGGTVTCGCKYSSNRPVLPEIDPNH